MSCSGVSAKIWHAQNFFHKALSHSRTGCFTNAISKSLKSEVNVFLLGCSTLAQNQNLDYQMQLHTKMENF